MATTPLTVIALKSLIASLGFPEIHAVPNKPKDLRIVVSTDDELKTTLSKVFQAVKIYDPKIVIPPTKGPYKPEAKILEVSGLKLMAMHKRNVKTPKEAGIKNEKDLYGIISGHLKVYEKFDIHFQVNGYTKLLVQNVIRVNKTGRKTEDRKKGDIELVTSFSEKIPLSLKQIDSPFWETADTYWGTNGHNMFEYALAHNLTHLEPFENVFRMYDANAIAVQATQQEAMDVVFGSDIHGRGAIVKQTWNEGHVRWDEIGILFLTCKNIIQEFSEIPEEDSVYFQIRNKKDKKSKYLYPGLFLQAVVKSVAKNNAILPRESIYFTK